MFKDWNLGGEKAILYVLVLYLLWDLVYSMQDVALWGMLALSSPRSEERTRAAQWTAIGVTVGGALAGLVPLIKDIAINNFGATDKSFFFGAALVLGLGGQLISMSAYKMEESVKNENKEKESLLGDIS